MNMKNMVKTIFTVYRFLDKLASSIDKIVETRALNSFYVSLDNISYNDISKVTNEILELTERKVTLINLKVLANEVLKVLDKDYARLIIMKYIENKPYLEIAEKLNISERTVRRWHNNAIVLCAFYLQDNKYTLNKFLSLLKKEKWILQIFYNFVNVKKPTNESYEKKHIIQDACIEYKKILCK
ncbi:MAG: sigma-70 region 4 domain-containing protein [Clostridia bacterium]|nr:sigma-70 region 4 domain-containing protein [Clostridia bacterium]MDD4685766.1 sigma-70 region 4 domain-containing protein [Clostridia bacterium]